MNYEGLAELMRELMEGGELDAWELENVRQLHSDADGAMLFAVTLSLGPIYYQLSSWMPAKQIVADIRRRLDEISK